MIELIVHELAEMAMQQESGKVLLFTKRDEKEQEDYECFITCVTISETDCLLVSNVGDGSASALNVTTYMSDLSEVVEWLSAFCMGDTIYVKDGAKC